MTDEIAFLNALLRLELTVVNQQFIHILALRQRGDEMRASRIYAVDRIDFPNALAIIDHLVAVGGLQPLASEPPRPGHVLAALLAAEAALEERLRVALEDLSMFSGVARRLAETAARPRAAYRDWLDQERHGQEQDGQEQRGATAEDAVAEKGETGIDRLFSCLIALIEQMMIHAFIYRQAGCADEADIAWATSGIAMVQAGDLVTALSGLGMMPRPAASPLLATALEPAAARRSDQRLIAAYAVIARETAMAVTLPETLSALCRRIADASNRLARWQQGAPHPALMLCAASFKSFEATLTKFLSG
ncbi:MAG TPA: hypothetical protein VM639_04720 [Dongiaceae bacterium]|nr:hypothetical protein [Dongiaceae bacterium]